MVVSRWCRLSTVDDGVDDDINCRRWCLLHDSFVFLAGSRFFLVGGQCGGVDDGVDCRRWCLLHDSFVFLAGSRFFLVGGQCGGVDCRRWCRCRRCRRVV